MNDGQEAGKWISSDHAFGNDVATRKIMVSDPVILHFNKNGPIDRVLVAATPARTVFTWAVFASTSAAQRTRMDNPAVRFTAGSAFSVLAKPTGSDNCFSARGNCQPGCGVGQVQLAAANLRRAKANFSGLPLTLPRRGRR